MSLLHKLRNPPDYRQRDLDEWESEQRELAFHQSLVYHPNPNDIRSYPITDDERRKIAINRYNALQRLAQSKKRVAYQANQNQMSNKRSYSSAQFDAEFGDATVLAVPSSAFKRRRTQVPLRVPKNVMRIPAMPRQQASLATQVRRLIQGKKKDAADITRDQSSALTTRLHCLSSSTSNATAASGTGIIATDSDRATINHVDIRGAFTLAPVICTTAQAAALKGGFRSRFIVVWFYKPLLDASAAGTVPPITEVLVSDSVDSMYVQDAANAGRFTILSDKTFNMGRSLLLSDSSLGQQGHLPASTVPFNYRVKVNKQMLFRAPANDANPGGHYDSDVTNGQITKGMLVLYSNFDLEGAVAGSDAAAANYSLVTRLNYTA